MFQRPLSIRAQKSSSSPSRPASSISCPTTRPYTEMLNWASSKSSTLSTCAVSGTSERPWNGGNSRSASSDRRAAVGAFLPDGSTLASVALSDARRSSTSFWDDDGCGEGASAAVRFDVDGAVEGGGDSSSSGDRLASDLDRPALRSRANELIVFWWVGRASDSQRRRHLSEAGRSGEAPRPLQLHHYCQGFALCSSTAPTGRGSCSLSFSLASSPSPPFKLAT